MKKYVAIVLVAATVFAFGACTKDNKTPESTTAQTQQETTQAPVSLRQIPTFELSKDYKTGTFSLDGKVYQLRKTAVQDFTQHGYEVSSEVTEFEINKEEEIVLKKNGKKFPVSVSVRPHYTEQPKNNIMDETLTINAVYFETENVPKEEMPELIIGGINFKEYKSLEDVKKAIGDGKIEDVGSGNRVFSVNDKESGMNFKVKDFADGRGIIITYWQI